MAAAAGDGGAEVAAAGAVAAWPAAGPSCGVGVEEVEDCVAGAATVGGRAGDGAGDTPAGEVPGVAGAVAAWLAAGPSCGVEAEEAEGGRDSGCVAGAATAGAVGGRAGGGVDDAAAGGVVGAVAEDVAAGDEAA